MNDFVKHGKASIVIDGQFGSTGKGLAAAYQAIYAKDVNWDKVICTTNAAPNAGHTTVLPDGTKFVTFHMPTMGVLKQESTIYLNAGAIIDFDVLQQEIKDLNVDPERIRIHPNAAVITQDDKDFERQKTSGATQIASTQKGVGRALARKIMREGKVAKDYEKEFAGIGIQVLRMELNEAIAANWAVVVETPQGMSLSINNGFYPHCTSREVSVAQSLSDAALHPSCLHKTLMTVRTYPIRVGNIVDDSGKVIGYSGDVYPDQRELSWDSFPHVEPERTTVTKRVRRIFTFSPEQYLESVARLRPAIVHVGFCDYLTDRSDFDELMSIMEHAHSRYGIRPDIVCSFGPSTDDVFSWIEARKRFG